MANRYWVGGTGNWAATTTNWSATSGGAGGASVPTLADDVFFDTLSNATAYVVTLTTAPVCRSVNVAGPATGNVTIAGSAAWSIYGSLTIAATGVTWANTSNITYSATTTGWTITTNGVSLSNSTFFVGVGGGWSLGSALTMSTANGISITSGVFNTANFNITVNSGFGFSGALTKTINLGSSLITCQTWTASGSNTTFNAGTSTITLTATSFSGGGLTYYNVTKANNGFAIGDGGNTFNALTMGTVTVGGTFTCSFAGNQTIGTLTINGGANAAARASIQTPSTLAGTQITLTVASFVTNGYVDFRDINFQGAASPLTVSTGGDCGNNTNITLAAPKTVYWNLIAGGNWQSATAWALTSGGTPALANYPLPQDTVIIENTGLNSGASIAINNSPNIGTLSASTRTLPITFTPSSTNASFVYDNLTLSSAVTFTASTGTFTFSGYNKTQTITSAGASIANGFIVNNSTVTVTLADNLTSTAGFTLTSGTLNLSDKNLTCLAFGASGTTARSIAFGTGGIYLTGNAATIWNSDVGTNLSYTGTPNIYCTYSGATGTRQIQGSTTATATETNTFNFFITAGSDTVVIAGARRYRTLNFTGFSGTLTAWLTSMGIYGDFVASSAMTIAPTTIPLVFLATLITQKITTNGKTLSFPVNASNNLQLQDVLTIDPAYAFTLAIGTLDLNAKTLSSGTFSSTGASVRSIAFASGTIVNSGATFTVSGTNFSTSGTGTISMTSASSKTFAGGGFSYPTLNQGGAGALVITGANTFQNITNTVQPATVTLPAGSTTYVANFGLLGTAGNLITLNSSTSGTQAAISNTSGGFIGGNYLSLRDTNATPANTMYAGRNTTNVSNNTGWVFTNLFVDSVAETSTLTTTENSQIDFVPAIAESLTTTDSQSVRMDWNNLAVESFSSTDTVSAIAVYVPTVSETVVFSDSQIQRGWIRINDNQTPGWVNIDNTQG